MKKRVATLLLAVLLAVTSACASAAAAPGPLFTDLPGDHWSHQYVADLCEQGVVSGYPDGTFRPQGSVTYGEAFKLVLLALKLDAPAHIPEQHWAKPYLDIALDRLMILSFDGKSLDGFPTRREIGRMVARGLHLTDISGESPYDDCDDGYVVKLYEKELMVGFVNEDGTRSFHPDDPITREEMATIVWRVRNTDVTAGMFQSGTAYRYWVDGFEDLAPNPYTQGQFVKDERGRLSYTGGYYAHGIDVSRHKEYIDWEAVAGDGIDFAIIRAGARAWGTGVLLEDARFDENMQGAIA
ncbi:MAG: S-layer homology domain-containing protein, partial [Oscillospiraceae bacterium]|nr:S-layer homology domain-containing protein [Oscillospiraceae bacterium]